MTPEQAKPTDRLMTGFGPAGGDQKYQPAAVACVEKGKQTRGLDPSDGDQLLRPSLRIEQPIHFGYDWECNPLANVKVIGNKALPLVSQRSDDWDISKVLQGVMNDESARPVSREELVFL